MWEPQAAFLKQRFLRRYLPRVTELIIYNTKIPVQCVQKITVTNCRFCAIFNYTYDKLVTILNNRVKI